MRIQIKDEKDQYYEGIHIYYDRNSRSLEIHLDVEKWKAILKEVVKIE